MATYTDRIGDRLDRPENVPPELAHLIPDDIQRVKRILEFPVSGRVLDVGCSDGAITRRIAEMWGVPVVGADVGNAWNEPDPFSSESEIIDRDERGVFTGWMRWDARQPYPDAMFNALQPPYDLVYACEIFEHLTDADAGKALQNILDVLKPGGDLIVTVPNRYPHDNYVVQCRDRWRWPDHRQSFTVDKLIEFLRPANGSEWRLVCEQKPQYFGSVEMVPLYDGERYAESIWLIARAHGKL